MLGRGVTRDTEDRQGGRILPGILADPNTHEPILDANGGKIPNTIQLTENNLWKNWSDCITINHHLVPISLSSIHSFFLRFSNF